MPTCCGAPAGERGAGRGGAGRAWGRGPEGAGRGREGAGSGLSGLVSAVLCGPRAQPFPSLSYVGTRRRGAQASGRGAAPRTQQAPRGKRVPFWRPGATSEDTTIARLRGDTFVPVPPNPGAGRPTPGQGEPTQTEPGLLGAAASHRGAERRGRSALSLRRYPLSMTAPCSHGVEAPGPLWGPWHKGRNPIYEAPLHDLITSLRGLAVPRMDSGDANRLTRFCLGCVNCRPPCS